MIRTVMNLSFSAQSYDKAIENRHKILLPGWGKYVILFRTTEGMEESIDALIKNSYAAF